MTTTRLRILLHQIKRAGDHMQTIAQNAEYPILRANKLGCKSGHKYLLKGIDWEVKIGEHWLVFGMNGCGKTTLLSIMAGFKQHTEGIVERFGQSTSADTALSDRKNIGFVSASFFGKLYGNESAINIVLSGLSGTLGIDGEIPLDEIKRAKSLLDTFHLGDRTDYPFSMFSKGEQQSILIARALVNNPPLLILDEPCTGLDIYNREYLFETIIELSKRKDLSIIYVTHYVEEIIPIFTKTLLLKGGMLFCKGNTPEIITSEVFTSFIDYPVKISQDENNRYIIKLECKSNLVNKLVRKVEA